MITALVLSALAAVWGWFVLNDPKAPRLILWMSRTLKRLPKGEKLVNCPWCIGAWLSILSTVYLHWVMDLLGWTTPIAALAAAGLTGMLGGLIAESDEPT